MSVKPCPPRKPSAAVVGRLWYIPPLPNDIHATDVPRESKRLTSAGAAKSLPFWIVPAISSSVQKGHDGRDALRPDELPRDVTILVDDHRSCVRNPGITCSSATQLCCTRKGRFRGGRSESLSSSNFAATAARLVVPGMSPMKEYGMVFRGTYVPMRSGRLPPMPGP